MKRLFFKTELYDYSNKEEAENHIEEMRANNWIAKQQDNGEFIYENGQDELPYSVEFLKQL